jgi:hypothetical protein
MGSRNAATGRVPPEEEPSMTRNVLALGLCLATSSACATSQTQWRPTVDTYGSSRAQFLSRDTEECRSLAMSASGSTTEQAARGAVGGGLFGAAAGAAIGAAMGNAGRGAAIGAATGGFGGAARSGSQSNATFQRAFNQCMRNRGHTVLG